LPAALSTAALRRDVVGDGPELRDGQILLPDRPGLGITLNRDALERCRVA